MTGKPSGPEEESVTLTKQSEDEDIGPSTGV